MNLTNIRPNAFLENLDKDEWIGVDASGTPVIRANDKASVEHSAKAAATEITILPASAFTMPFAGIASPRTAPVEQNSINAGFKAVLAQQAPTNAAGQQATQSTFTPPPADVDKQRAEAAAATNKLPGAAPKPVS